MKSDAIQTAQPSGNLTASASTAQIFSLLSNSALAAVLNCPGSNRLEQIPFIVRASGLFTTPGITTVKPTLYAALAAPATPLVAADWTVLGAGAATATTAGESGAFEISAHLLFDSTSGSLVGSFKSSAGNAPVAAAALANILTGLNGASEPVCIFAVGLTFGAAAANIGSLRYFGLEA